MSFTMMKKILLVSTSSRYVLDKTLTSYSFALGFLSAVLSRNNYSVEILDLFCEEWKNGKALLLDSLKKFKPDAVGFNIITMNRFSTYEAINLIKKLAPKTKIILGGCHATIMYKQLLKNFPIDAIVLGEGEETIIDLLKNFDNLKKVKGIAFMHKNQLIKTAPRDFIKDLDSLPIVEHNRFINKDSKVAFVFTSRGCPYNCSFCSASLHWKRICRFRSTSSVIKEIEHLLLNYPNLEEIRFMDDNFTMNNDRVIEICKEMIKRKLKIKWRCSGRVYPLSKEMIKWLDKAGCIMIGFGVESGSQKLLNEIGKNQTREQIIDAYKTIYENSKITPDTFLIVGLPGENESTINETIDLIKKINKIGKKPLLLTAARMLEIYPGTKIYEIAKAKGMVNDDYWLKHSETPVYLEHDKKWLKKMRRRIILANWTSCGLLPIIKLFFQKRMWNPRKIYNILRPYIRGIN